MDQLASAYFPQASSAVLTGAGQHLSVRTDRDLINLFLMSDQRSDFAAGSCLVKLNGGVLTTAGEQVFAAAAIDHCPGSLSMHRLFVQDRLLEALRDCRTRMQQPYHD